MSVDCTWHLLIPVGSLTAESLIQVGDLLGARGLVPQRGPGNAIWLLNSDGTGTVTFEEVSSATSWLANEGGLMSFVGGSDADELSLSVHHAMGVLASELRGFGDSPAFDEVQLVISAHSASARGAAWGAFDADALAVSELCRAVFAWCIDDESLEAAGPLSVHQALLDGKLPAFRASAMAVPQHSPLSMQLHGLAELAHAVLSLRLGWWELRAESGLCAPVRNGRKAAGGSGREAGPDAITRLGPGLP